ncbi:MAG: hypothetical protein M3Q71_16335 [Chloroflexota bacterium]|nr:hypothetical protein [Chloroflexota bacterium]
MTGSPAHDGITSTDGVDLLGLVPGDGIQQADSADRPFSIDSRDQSVEGVLPRAEVARTGQG